MAELPLFVFGTLRQGEENHHYLAGRYARWLPATLRDFTRTVAAHGFPAAVRADGGIILGELYLIRPEDYEKTLRECDQLEDIPPGELAGPFYRRAEVTVETEEGPYSAWAYVDPTE